MNHKSPIHLNHSNVTMAIFVIVTLPFFINCSSNNKPQLTDSIAQRKLTPQLYADSITTIISDSGIIRYRINALEWSVFDRTDTPYWDFPLGIRFERFDTRYNVDAEIQADKAIYYNELELWKLNGNVKAINLKGEQFITEELFWNQKSETVYSDSAITIIQKNQTIYGIGFHSNQNFTKYSIRQPKGSFPIEE